MTALLGHAVVDDVGDAMLAQTPCPACQRIDPHQFTTSDPAGRSTLRQYPRRWPWRRARRLLVP